MTAEAACAPVRGERAEHVGNVIGGNNDAESGGSPAYKSVSIRELRGYLSQLGWWR